MISAAILQRIVEETFIERIDYQETLESTNNRSHELADLPANQFPLLVWSEFQTAGRGRGSNRWWSSRGALTFSLTLATEMAELPSERWPQVSLTVGLAVCEALEQLLARGVPPTSLATLPAVELKWPNDVYIEGRKICGVLVEVPRGPAKRLLLGIGINVNNSLSEAPAELQDAATSLLDLTGRQFELDELLVLVLQRLAAQLSPADFWNTQVREGWRRRCLLTGKKIQIDLEVRQRSGICRGIDDEGALLLEVDGTIERHFAGVITLLSRE